jgi:hypothetical protein
MKILVLLVGVLAAVIALPAHARNLSSVDGNTLLVECHAAQQMDEVSPKLNSNEWAAGLYCLGFVQGVVDADNIWQTAEKKALGSRHRGRQKRAHFPLDSLIRLAASAANFPV